MPEIYHWVNKEKLRYFTITINKDMLSDTVLTFSWGGSRKGGGHKHLLVKSQEEIERHINNMIKRRGKRGYQLVAPQ